MSLIVSLIVSLVVALIVSLVVSLIVYLNTSLPFHRESRRSRAVAVREGERMRRDFIIGSEGWRVGLYFMVVSGGVERSLSASVSAAASAEAWEGGVEKEGKKEGEAISTLWKVGRINKR